MIHRGRHSVIDIGADFTGDPRFAAADVATENWKSDQRKFNRRGD
jgi:hypothetical protein